VTQCRLLSKDLEKKRSWRISKKTDQPTSKKNENNGDNKPSTMSRANNNKEQRVPPALAPFMDGLSIFETTAP